MFGCIEREAAADADQLTIAYGAVGSTRAAGHHPTATFGWMMGDLQACNGAEIEQSGNPGVNFTRLTREFVEYIKYRVG